VAASRSLLRFFIGGEWVTPEEGFSIHAMVDPATEQVSGEVAFGTSADIDRAVDAARGAFPAYSASAREERLALLERICAVYERRLSEVAVAITDEMGAPLETLSRTLQAPAGQWHFQSAAACLKTYEFERRAGTTCIVREPIGVCGLVTPWNWPVNQVVCKVAPALAVGCTVVLKPSQHSCYSAQLIAEIMDEARVPAGVFNMVYGEGRTLGNYLAGHPDVEMISLTGSTSAGIQVSRAAADTVKRVSLELGGKSANIILREAPLAQAIAHGVQLMMSNTGQSCSAPSRLLVPREKLDEVEALAAHACRQLVLGDPRDAHVHIGPLANEQQFNKVREMIERGLEEGAKLVVGGSGRPAGLNRGYYVQPTVFSRATNQMTISREEIFGPVLVIIPYDSEDEAVAIANDSSYGLSGCVYGATIDRARAIARRLRTGNVHLNGASVDLAAPFGGYKQSGNGREWGVFGLDEFVEVKAIMGSEIA